MEAFHFPECGRQIPANEGGHFLTATNDVLPSTRFSDWPKRVLPDATAGQPTLTEHLRKRLQADSDSPGGLLVRNLTQQIEIHQGGGEQSDDITLITGRRLT